MQVSASLAEFMSQLEEGPQGADDALAIISQCASEKSAVLDLQQLTLTDEDFEVIAPKLATVASHVKTLNLFMNELSVLPSSIAALSNLEVLHAGCNPLERVEGDLIEGLSKLQELDVGFSEILEELPDAFSGCQSLQLVHAGNGRLNSLPPSLFRCEMLQELHVYGNSLKELSEELGNLVNLQVLNIGRNQITKVPDTIGKCSSLHTLHLYENCLADLPTGVTNLQNLKTLNVDSNAGMPDLPRSVRSKSGALASAEFYVTEKVQ